MIIQKYYEHHVKWGALKRRSTLACRYGYEIGVESNKAGAIGIDSDPCNTDMEGPFILEFHDQSVNVGAQNVQQL